MFCRNSESEKQVEYQHFQPAAPPMAPLKKLTNHSVSPNRIKFSHLPMRPHAALAKGGGAIAWFIVIRQHKVVKLGSEVTYNT